MISFQYKRRKILFNIFIFYFILFHYTFTSNHKNKIFNHEQSIAKKKFLDISHLIKIKSIEKEKDTIKIILLFGDEEIIYYPTLGEYIWRGASLHEKSKNNVLIVALPPKNIKKIQSQNDSQINVILNNPIQLYLPLVFKCESFFYNSIDKNKIYYYSINGARKELKINDENIPNIIEGKNLQENSVYIEFNDSSIINDKNYSLQILEVKNEEKNIKTDKNFDDRLQDSKNNFFTLPKNKINTNGLYRVHEEKQGNLIVLKYYTDNNKNPSLIVYYNHSNRTIEKYEIKSNNTVIFNDNINSTKTLAFHIYPSFSLRPNSFFTSIIFPKLLKRMKLYSDFKDWEKIAIILSPVHSYKRQEISLSKIIENKMNNNPKLLDNMQYLIFILPLDKLAMSYNNIDHYHTFAIYFLFEKVHNTWVLKNALHTTSTTSGTGVLNNEWLNFFNSIRYSNIEKNFNDINTKKDSTNNLVMCPSLFTKQDPMHLIKFLQTKQLGAFCCYSAIYKDIMRTLINIPSLIDNTNNKLMDSAIIARDNIMTATLTIEKTKEYLLLLPNLIGNFFLHYKIHNNINNISTGFIFDLLIENTDCNVKQPITEEYKKFIRDYILDPSNSSRLMNYAKVNNIDFDKIMESLQKSYVIRCYCNKNKEIFIYVIYKKLDNTAGYEEFVNIFKKKCAENLPGYKIISVDKLSYDQWTGTDPSYLFNPQSNKNINSYDVDNENIRRLNFLVKFNFLETVILHDVNLNRISGLDLYFFYKLCKKPLLNTDLNIEKLEKIILNDVADDCFFHILFHVSLLFDQDEILSNKLVDILIGKN